MTATLIVQPEAEADLAEAFRWYEVRRAGLGHEFLDEVSRAFTRVSGQPLRYAIVQVRRVLLRRFPYAVFYIARVIACSCWRFCISAVTHVSLKLVPATSKRSDTVWTPALRRVGP